jgi:RNA polymerase sigma-70 factor (ECF subfamily)
MDNDGRLPTPFHTDVTDQEDDEFRAFFDAHRPGLLRYLTMRLGNAHDAEDVLQEAIMRFLGARQTQDIDNPYAFLVRICSAQAVDRIRQNTSRGRRERQWSDAYYRSQSTEGEMGSATASQDREFSARADIEAVVAALGDLSETVRRAFILHRFDGLTHGEVAERLGLSRSTVEKHIIKAGRHVMRRLHRH